MWCVVMVVRYNCGECCVWGSGGECCVIGGSCGECGVLDTCEIRSCGECVVMWCGVWW